MIKRSPPATDTDTQTLQNNTLNKFRSLSDTFVNFLALFYRISKLEELLRPSTHFTFFRLPSTEKKQQQQKVRQKKYKKIQQTVINHF